MEEWLSQVMEIPRVRKWAGTPGHQVSVGVVHPSGTTLQVSGQNVPDGERQSRLYEIGSVTKTLTGLLLAVGEQKGTWSRNDTIADLIPEWSGSPFARQTTLLQLVTHTAGLGTVPGNFKAAVRDRMNPYAHYTESLLTEAIMSETPKPQSRHRYSNYGFGLLGWILARKAGLTYSEALSRWVLEPLGMPNTVLGDSPPEEVRLQPVYNSKGKPVPHWDFQETMAGAGAVRSTLADMLQYLQAHLRSDGHVLGPSLRECRDEHYLLFRDRGIGVGYAWFFYREKDGSTTYWHNGGTYGSSSFASFNPDKQTGMVILSNYGSSVWSQIPLIGARKMNVDKLATILTEKLYV